MKTLILKGAFTALVMATLCSLTAVTAQATCVSPLNRLTPVTVRGLPATALASASPASLNVANAPKSANASTNNDITGMYIVNLYIGSGPDLYDQQFDQWYDDGHEVSLSNAVPPALGNVCLGIWKKSGPKTYQLKHFAWNFDLAGKTTGTFVITETVTLTDKGSGYRGTFVADSFDLNGYLIPELHAEGLLVGTRLSVD